jgi:glycosyltransferase involved in cell wall biosynthesis
MKIAIDATNIKSGGGLTHLKRIMEYWPISSGTVYLIGGVWLKEINVKENVEKIIFEHEYTNLWRQEFFKFFRLKKYLKDSDIAFIPGGTFSSKKIKYISMSQNMLVFQKEERNRYGYSFMWLRLKVLEYRQKRSFKNSCGIIYISNFAKNFIENKYPFLKKKKSKVIYHGISKEFQCLPRPQYSIDQYTFEKPYKILYVSIIDVYKHQWNVMQAIKRLRNEDKINISLELVGPIYKPLKKKVGQLILGSEDFIKYNETVPYEEIVFTYKNADMFVFASSCENMPNILLEAMACGLPVLSSNFGPMPEILRDAGEYMDPLCVDSIYAGIKKLIFDPIKRAEISQKAFNYANNFSWETTTIETFNFIKSILI